MSQSWRRTPARVLLSAAMVLLAGCPAPLRNGEPDEQKSLAVPYIAQQTQVWCWAAAMESVLRYYGYPLSQCSIVSDVLLTDCCYVPGIVCLQTASLETMQRGVFYHSGISSTVTGPLSYPQIAREIDEGRPVVAAYSNSFSGHVVVIYGYNAGRDTISVHDPFLGTYEEVRYNNSFSYAAAYEWSNSIVFNSNAIGLGVKRSVSLSY